MFIVFLDIDGVLNEEFSDSKTPMGFTGIDDDKVAVLAKIIEYFDARIVLTTTWKKEWDKDRNLCTVEGIYMIDKLHYEGRELIITDKTTDNLTDRGKGIENWLSLHPEVTDYLVFDDYEFDFDTCAEVRKHVVKTVDGILTAHTFNADYTQSVYEALQIIREIKSLLD